MAGISERNFLVATGGTEGAEAGAGALRVIIVLAEITMGEKDTRMTCLTGVVSITGMPKIMVREMIGGHGPGIREEAIAPLANAEAQQAIEIEAQSEKAVPNVERK